MQRIEILSWLLIAYLVGVWVGRERNQATPERHSSQCQFDSEAYVLPTINPETGRSTIDPLNEVKECRQSPATTIESK